MINISEYLEKRLAGSDYASIRKELEKQGLQPNEIKDIINEIDEKYLKIITQKQNKGISSVANGLIRLITGVLLLSFSFVLIYFAINHGLGFLDAVILMFCLPGGYWLFTTGRKAMKLALEKKVKLGDNNPNVLDV